jgi:hypothetical protein
MTSTKGDQTMRKPKENVKEIAQPSKQLIKEKAAFAMVRGLDPLTYFDVWAGAELLNNANLVERLNRREF